MIRILLAEDEAYIRQAYQIGLGRQGYEVIIAVDGMEAWEKAQAELPDMILLDMIMPRKQGVEVLTLLQNNPKTKAIPVIVLTNLSQTSDERQMYQLGAKDFIVKSDYSMKEVLTRIEKHLPGDASSEINPDAHGITK